MSGPAAGAGRDRWTFAHKLAVTLASLIVLALAWRLASVLMLAFGGIVFAIALRRLGIVLHRLLRMPPAAGVLLALVLVLGGLVLFGLIAGDAIGAQIGELRERLPRAISAASDWIDDSAAGRWLLDAWAQMDLPLRQAAQRVMSAAGITLGALASLVLMLILAVWLAFDPHPYLAGALRLLPPAQRRTVARALQASGDGLARWLLGQAIAMLFLGVATMIGLSLLGVPMALVLGVMTGLLAFVPFFGAIAAGVISVLLAFTEGPRAALHVALLFFAIQQIEDYALHPLVQRWARALPPVLTLVAAAVFGTLFGIVGVIFAAPLMVVTMILVEKLYIENLLERPAQAPEAGAAGPIATPGPARVQASAQRRSRL